MGNLTERNHSEHLNRRLEDNTKKDLKEIGWEGVGWIYVAQDMEEGEVLVKMATNLRDT